MDDLGKTWMFSSNPPWHNYFVLSIYLAIIQKNCHYLHVCAKLQETPIELFQKLHGQLAKKEMLGGDDSCYLSDNCPFEKTISLSMVSHLQFCSQVTKHSNNGNFLAWMITWKTLCLPVTPYKVGRHQNKYKKKDGKRGEVLRGWKFIHDLISQEG